MLFFDIENLANLLNSDWGTVERTRYEYERDVVSAAIVDGQYEYSVSTAIEASRTSKPKSFGLANPARH